MSAAGIAFGATGGNLAGSAAAQEGTEAEIVLPAQQTNGFEIEIETATIPDGGFISLVDPVNPHEKMWPVVGETMPTEQEVIESQTIATTEYLEPGTHENLVLELDRPLDFGHNVEDERDTRDIQQKLYQVWMHHDPAGDQSFENVMPGGEETRYTYEQEGQHPSEVNEIVIGEAYLEFARFNPSALRSQLQETESQLQETESQISELESQLSELESANEEDDERISELQEQRETLNQEVSDLEERIAELEESNQNTETSSSDDSGPGFGIVTALVGGAAGAAAAMKRLGGSKDKE
jgi:hypothetical protein